MEGIKGQEWQKESLLLLCRFATRLPYHLSSFLMMKEPQLKVT
jgi:hypothetical protein